MDSKSEAARAPWKLAKGGRSVNTDDGGKIRMEADRSPVGIIATMQLVSAAPDLLAALEGLMEWEEEIAADLRLHTSPEPILAQARAAIARAKGETP